MAGAIPKKVRSRRSFSILTLVVRILFIAALLSAAGLFGYKIYLERDLVAQKEALTAASMRFNQTELDSVTAFDNKLQVAVDLLDVHVAPSKIFTALEETTKSSIQYTGFNYARGIDGSAVVTIDGVTNKLGSVALQEAAYAENDLLDGVTITEVTLGTSDEGGGVEFSIVARLSGGDFAYENIAPLVETVPAANASSTESTAEEVPGAGSTTPAVTP